MAISMSASTSRTSTPRDSNPPEGYDNFEITWDFGNASGQTIVRSALRTRDKQGYLSVPVVHAYDTDRFSPYRRLCQRQSII